MGKVFIEGSITGHASPQWKNPGKRDKDELNKLLSIKRANEVRYYIQELFHRKLSQEGIQVEFAVQSTHERDTEIISLPTDGVGDSVTIDEAGGNTNANEAEMRRADINIVVTHQIEGKAGMTTSLFIPEKCQDNATYDWAIKLIIGGGAGHAGLGVAFAFGEIKNRKTRQKATGAFTGGGIGVGVQTPGVDPGWSDWTNFRTNQRVTFDHFDGTLCRLTTAGAGFLVGGSLAYISFPWYGANSIFVGGFNVASIGADAGTNIGRWDFTTPVPGAKCVPEHYIPNEETAPYTYDIEDALQHSVKFGTGNSKINDSELRKLEKFVTHIVGRMTGDSSYVDVGDSNDSSNEDDFTSENSTIGHDIISEDGSTNDDNEAHVRNFPDALRTVATTSTSPSQYERQIPDSFYSVLWDVHKALNWHEELHHTAEEFGWGALHKLKQDDITIPLSNADIDPKGEYDYAYNQLKPIIQPQTQKEDADNKHTVSDNNTSEDDYTDTENEDGYDFTYDEDEYISEDVPVTKEYIEELFNTEYSYYGLKKSELRTIRTIKNASGSTLDKIDFFKSDVFRNNLSYTMNLLEKTDIKNYHAYKDIGLVLAILSRETGPLRYRYYKYMVNDPTRRFVTSGADVHPSGIAGFDFMMSTNQSPFHRKNFEDADISITSVRKSELKPGKSNRSPGRVEVRHILFATFSMLAYCEKKIKLHLGTDTFENMDINAKRVWIALYFALPSMIKKLRDIIKRIERQDEITSDSANLILSEDTPPPNTKGTLKRARGIGLKAHVFELCCGDIM